MARKCPPGVICIENITIIFLIFILCLAAFIWYKFGNININTGEKVGKKEVLETAHNMRVEIEKDLFELTNNRGF